MPTAPMTSSVPPVLCGLRAIAPQYDAFLVDLWGVIHDGVRPFPGASDALRALASAGRPVVFVTNSSRTGARVADMLSEMGIGPELYRAVVSSGDVTRDALIARDAGVFGLLPEQPRCWHFGDRAFVPWLFELGLSFVDELANADLVVATGGVADDAGLARVRRLLAPAAARGLPLVCTNPDRVIPGAAGLTLGPGAVARAYTQLGGRVFLYGKPHAPIYEAARRHLAQVPTSRLVAIGDLLETDIQGARAARIASVLITQTGGHAVALGTAPGCAALGAAFRAAEVTPDMLLERFAW
ncbi:MAG TPA: TIGR01459 family HAD-type hydrolase [Polyangiaceae bacterium]|nr:TIGR01459 family HAD-type hydrolase [Polyangiaceae bacterium]